MMQIIHAMLVAEPRLYLDEIRTWLRLVDAKHGISHGSAHAAVKALGFTNQSIELVAAQRRMVNRSSFLAMQAAEQHQDIRRFYFIDETSKGKGDMRRRRGYGQRGNCPNSDVIFKVLIYLAGEPIQCREPFLPTTSYSTLACYNHTGFVGWRLTS